LRGDYYLGHGKCPGTFSTSPCPRCYPAMADKYPIALVIADIVLGG